MVKLLFDEMLKRTATWCRIFGVDSTYVSKKSDTEIIKIAREEGRVVITRDEELAKRCSKHSIPFLFLEEDSLSHQLSKLKSYFGEIFTFPEKTRCPKCNGLLELVQRDKVAGKVPEAIYKRNEKFWFCTTCGKIYWAGSHWKNITRIFKAIK